MTTADRQVIDFSVFLFHRLARAWGMSPQGVYQALSSVGIIESYIVPFYDVLHTLGEQSLVEEITELARRKGAIA